MSGPAPARPARRAVLAAAALAAMPWARTVGAASPDGSASASQGLASTGPAPAFAPRIRAPWQPPPPDPARERERQGWLAQGETSLAALDADAAEQAFDRAGRLAHAADAEIGLARTHMQRGDYGRALASAAHTGGDHPESAAGSALHAWLLRLSGDAAGAARVLAAVRSTEDRRGVVAATRDALLRDEPVASGALLQAPARLAPFGPPVSGAGRRRVIASGTLLPDGRLALAPAVGALAAPGGRRVFVRDGLGRLSPATVLRRADGVALLRLERPWSPGIALQAAQRDAFPGSVGHAAHHATADGAEPSWPFLATGFVGAPVDTGRRSLAFGSQRSPGGPVFDASSRLVGIVAGRTRTGPAELVGCAELERRFGRALLPVGDAAPAARAGVERIYEAAMRFALQVIA